MSAPDITLNNSTLTGQPSQLPPHIFFASIPTSGKTSFTLQSLTLWMQYMNLISSVNIPFPGSLHWLFSAIAFAFASITSGSLS